MGMSKDWTQTLAGFRRRLTALAGLMMLAAVAAGCQTAGPTVSNHMLLAHLPGIDFSGLKPMHSVEGVKASCSTPGNWKMLKLQKTALYTHQQWKAPSAYTGTGVIYIRMPMPLSASTVLWFAKLEYSKKGTTGQALGEWTDSLGRPWFEAENEKYHVRGYAFTEGLNAWIVYYGYKTTRPPNAIELNLAARAVDTVVPQTAEQPAAKLPAPSVKTDLEKKLDSLAAVLKGSH
jgi:hypothetical protein